MLQSGLHYQMQECFPNVSFSDCNLWFCGNIYAVIFLSAVQRHLERKRAGKWILKACDTGQMLPKLNIPLLMYICTDEDGNVTHFLPVVKCTLICCATQSEPQSIFRPLWRQALNWLDVGEKADWLARVMFTLCCLYVVFQNGSWWELNITHWKSKYRGILGPSSWSLHNVADGPPSVWKYLFQCLVNAESNI